MPNYTSAPVSTAVTVYQVSDGSRSIVRVPTAADATAIVNELNAAYQAGVASVTPSPAPTPTQPAMLMGVSIAVAEFAQETQAGVPGTMGAQYEYAADQHFAYFINKGMNCIRVPFLWERVQRTRGGELSAADIAGLDRNVQSVTGRGAYCLLDMHNYGRRWNGSGAREVIGKAGSSTSNAHFADFWRRIAERYKANSRVIFGLCNEPFEQNQAELVTTLNAGITAIRNTGATQMIFAGPNHWSGAHTWTWTDNPTYALQIRDPLNNLVIELHQYLDNQWMGVSTTCIAGSGGARNFDAVTSWARANGKKLFLGEFSFGRNTGCYTEANAHLEYIHKNSDVWRGWTYWAGGPWWGESELVIQPADINNPIDRPQMAVLLPFIRGTWQTD